MTESLKIPSVLVAHRRDYRGDMRQAVAITRPTMWGNPYPVSKFGRPRAIAYFRTWWYTALNAPMRQHALAVLPGTTLLCVCKPNDCHGDVIAEYVNAWVEQRVLLVS